MRSRPLLLTALFAAYAAPYFAEGHLRFPLSAAVLVILLAKLYPGEFRRWLRPRDLPGLVLTAVAVFVGAISPMRSSAELVGLSFVPPRTPALAGLAIVLQAALQELVLRGALLTEVRRRMGSSWAVSVLAAAVFVGVHVAYYGTSLLQVRGTLVVVSLFAFSLFGNLFFLSTGRLWLPIAAHAAWNVLVLGGEFNARSHPVLVSEAEVFGLALGSPVVAAVSTGAALVSLVLHKKAPQGSVLSVGRSGKC